MLSASRNGDLIPILFVSVTTQLFCGLTSCWLCGGSGVWGGQQWDGRYHVGAYATYEHARSQNCYSHVQAERGREGV